MPNAYVTYFDKNYLVKGLALLESLVRHNPGCTVRVVCLDDETFSLLVACAPPNCVPVRLAVIEANDAALAEAKGNRSLVEYYWTLTPTILARLLAAMPENAVLTYVDADMYFFSSPAVIFDELGDRAVFIHKHNFSPSYMHAAVNGIFNVGLVAFRNDAAGRAVLDWWRLRCLEWCYNRCEDGKMGDQKYLESFEHLTDRLVISANPGVGVAPWNQSRYTLGENADHPLVDGKPAVFYHYHAAAYMAPGCLAPTTDIHYSHSLASLRLFALPYLRALDAALGRVRAQRPDFAWGFKADDLTRDMCIVVTEEREEAFQDDFFCIVPLAPGYKVCVGKQLQEYENVCGPVIRAGDLAWVGSYPDWWSAEKAAGGYDTEEIFDKARDAARMVRDGKALWERDSVLFHEPQWNWPLLTALLGVAARDQGRLHVLDFGGAFGSTYMQNREALGHLPACTWHVVEQEHFVRSGQAEFTSDTLRFHRTVEDACADAPINVVLLSSVLQYLEKPYALLKKLLALRVPLIIDRTPMLEDEERITVQRVPSSIYRASYACRWLDKRRLLGLVHAAGYAISPLFASSVDPQGFWGLIATPEVAKATTVETEAVEASARPLRIMQADDFYIRYLDDFYRSRPGLALKGSAEQGKALFDDAFSAVHAVVPYLGGLPGVSCETEYFVANCFYEQRAWAKENGVSLDPASPAWVEDCIRARVARFRPDVLYLADPIRFSADFIRSLPYKPRLILGWRGADIPFGIDWKGYDIMLSGLPRLLEAAESLGVKKGVLFHPGMPEWLADKVATIPQDTDVCFVGGIYPGQHDKRLSMLDFLARSAAKYGFSLNLHLACAADIPTPAMRPYLRPPAFGLAMHEALRRARIVVDDRAHHAFVLPDGSKKIDLGGEDTINMRLFETTGGGSLLLTEALEGLRRYFEPGIEAVAYRSVDEMVAHITCYLGHPEEREAIARAGRARCLGEHNMTRRARAFWDIIQDNLGGM